jgi:hypothetical protein
MVSRQILTEIVRDSNEERQRNCRDPRQSYRDPSLWTRVLEGAAGLSGQSDLNGDRKVAAAPPFEDSRL